MAVENKLNGGNAQTQSDESLLRLKHVLDTITQFEQRPDIDDKQIQEQCTDVILDLVKINVPINSSNIREFFDCLISIGHILERLIRKTSASEQIFMNCLQTLYTQLVAQGMKKKKFFFCDTYRYKNVIVYYCR